ncbi:MAG: class I SAM-dependent methyltransferase [Gammaproteobacteria bacterium]|nr:MAG: class I SAM-dependent methyltransferase [Gammaproteobacteria bacterium]
MSAQSKNVFNRLYRSAEHAEDLPWHEAEPPELLAKALDQRSAPGTALDVGCGAGTYSLYMAGRGYRVTAIDFMPQAIAMLQARLRDTELDITAVQDDIGTWSADRQFDVVLDIGCLHTPGTIDRHLYKQQLLKWLAPGGDFILLHFGRRGWWDKWPIGPGRVSANVITDLFQPELKLLEYQPQLRGGMPWFMGRSALIGRYWFQRPG